MANYSFSVLFALLLIGCAGNDGTQKPDNLIPAGKMADILAEVHLAEAQVGRYTLRSSDSSMLVFNRIQTKLMKKYGVDTSAYRQSYIYYSSHPEQFEAIYKDVTEQLQKLSTGTSGSATAPGSTTPSGSSAPQSGSATRAVPDAATFPRSRSPLKKI